jgi:HAD superfamily hydrolase (TIGR01662 family)
VLQQVGGFDERFPRAYREDADLALRVRRAGYALVVGERQVIHPVRPASWRASIRLQAGNADDVLMAKLHGSRWRVDAGAPPGRLARHRLIAGCGALAVASAVMGRRRLAGAGAALWLAGTGELAWARLRPGPLTTGEIGRMVATSAVLPAAASLWWLRGLAKWRTAQPSVMGRPAAVLFDRDGTLVADVPYNGDPDAVVALPGARQALERIRRAGLPIAVVSNQSGVGRKGLGRDQVDAVNTRVEQLLGPFDAWCICPHAPEAGCGCRKPAPGLILSAARRLGVTPERCVVIGDIGADVEAARAAGARSILVPTPQTRVEEVAAAPEVAIDLLDAVGRVLEGP